MLKFAIGVLVKQGQNDLCQIFDYGCLLSILLLKNVFNFDGLQRFVEI